MTQRVIVGISRLSLATALLCGALVAASGANALPLLDFTTETSTTNAPGTASSATLQTQISVTNTGTATGTATVALTPVTSFTAPTAPPGSLLLQTSISGSVGISGSNGDNLLGFTGYVDGDTLNSEPECHIEQFNI